MKRGPNRKTLEKEIATELSNIKGNIIYTNGKLRDHKSGPMHDIHRRSKNDLETKKEQLWQLQQQVINGKGKTCAEIYEELKRIKKQIDNVSLSYM